VNDYERRISLIRTRHLKSNDKPHSDGPKKPSQARLLLAVLIEATMIVARAKQPSKALAGCEITIDKMLTALLDT
jgi:hypothetical protein